MKKDNKIPLIKNFKKFATHRLERPKNAGKILKRTLIALVLFAAIFRLFIYG